MYVGGLVLDPNTQAPVVVLKDEKGELHLPIWIGIAEATSIASAIKQVPVGRPLTHDLMFSALTEVGVTVQRVIITDLKDDTYYSEIILSAGDKAFILDSRPSDSIALALRASVPIFVVRSVLERAQLRFSGQGEEPSADPNQQSQEDGSTQPVNGEGEQPPPTGEGKDLSRIDKDKWDEILKSLDPDDFKYKM